LATGAWREPGTLGDHPGVEVGINRRDLGLRRLGLTWSASRKLHVEEGRFIGVMINLVSLMHRRTSGYSRMLINDQRDRSRLSR